MPDLSVSQSKLSDGGKVAAPHPYVMQDQKEERPMEMIEKLSLAGIVPVIKVEDAADAVPLCKALSDGGLPSRRSRSALTRPRKPSAACMPSCPT